MKALRRLWESIFGRKPIVFPMDEAKTAPLDPEALTITPVGEPRQHVLLGVGQLANPDMGSEERSLCVMLGKSDGSNALPDFGFLCLADTENQGPQSAKAAALAVRTAAQTLTEGAVLGLLAIDPRVENRSMQDLLRSSFQSANQLVLDQAPGSGTPMTAVVLLGDQLTIAHVGECRAHLIRGNNVTRLSSQGAFDNEARAQHAGDEPSPLARSSRSSREAVGQNPHFRMEVYAHTVPQDGYLLLCSEGLWEKAGAPEVLRTIRAARHPQTACDDLLKLAGGEGAVSAALIQFPPRKLMKPA